MQTLRLRVSDKIYKRFIRLLARFKAGEILVLNEDEDFVSTREYLKSELEKVESGQAEFMTLEDFLKLQQREVARRGELIASGNMKTRSWEEAKADIFREK